MGALITSIVFPPMRSELTKLNKSTYPQSRILSPFLFVLSGKKMSIDHNPIQIFRYQTCDGKLHPDRCRSQFEELIGQRDCSESAGQPCRQGGRHQQQPAPPEVSLAVMTTLRAEVDVKKNAIAQSLVNLPQRERLFTHPLNDN